MKKNELLEKFVNQFNGIIAPGAESLNKEIPFTLMRGNLIKIPLFPDTFQFNRFPVLSTLTET